MLKLFLMTKNEHRLLDDWLKYHGHLFGLENIHVLDGSNDTRIFEIYDRYEPMGLNVHRTATGLNGLGDELTRLMHAYKGANDFLIKLDTDEFLAYTLPHTLQPRGSLDAFVYRRYLATHKSGRGSWKWCAGTLMDLRQARKSLRVDDFEKFFAALPVTGQRYKASLTTWSIPGERTVHDVCRGLTDFTPLQFTHIKTFFHSESFVSVDLGSHQGVSTNNEDVIDTGLTVIHYHSVSFEDSIRRARQALVSHGYIAEEDPVREQREKLNAVRSGRVVASRHKINIYLHYLDILESGKPANPDVLNSNHPFFRRTGPGRKLTLVRDTLHEIDRARNDVLWLRKRPRRTAPVVAGCCNDSCP